MLGKVDNDGSVVLWLKADADFVLHELEIQILLNIFANWFCTQS